MVNEMEGGETTKVLMLLHVDRSLKMRKESGHEIDDDFCFFSTFLDLQVHSKKNRYREGRERCWVQREACYGIRRGEQNYHAYIN